MIQSVFSFYLSNGYYIRLQFVHIDPSEVAKHGIIRSLFHQLDENVLYSPIGLYRPYT